MKKPICLALASALSLSIVFSGCAQKQSPKTPATYGKSSAPLNLSVEIWDRGDSLTPNKANDNPVSRWVVNKVKKDLNINLSYIAVPRSEEVDKLNIMMAGGTAPDLIFTYNSSLVASYGANGGVLDLAPYISKYGSQIKSQLGGGLKYGVVNGKQYAIPSKRVDDADKHMTYINTTLLKKYKLPMPTTKAVLYKDMVAVHKANSKIVPYAMGAPTNDVKYYENAVMSYAKYPNTKSFAEWNVDDTRLLAPGTENGYKELNKWYSQGLISKDFALDTNEKQYTADISNGNVFAFTAGAKDPWWSLLPDAKKANGTDYLPTLCFENYKGQYANDLYYPIGVYNMIPKASAAHAQAAIQYLNWLANPTNYNTLKSGICIGVGKKDASGLYVSTVDMKTKGAVQNNISDICVAAKSDIEYSKTSQYVKLYESYINTKTYKVDKAVEAYYKLIKPKGSYYAPYFGAPGPVSAKNDANVIDAIHSMAARVITCKPASFTSTFNNEYNNVMSLGLKAMLDERGAQYDSSKK